MATTLEHNIIVTCDECGNERIIEMSDMLDGRLSDTEKHFLVKEGWFFFHRKNKSAYGGDKCHCPNCVEKFKSIKFITLSE